ncbi:hypothetical protein DEJ05_08315 [Curtobacterium sp. MCLR17_045]|uniref:hypothetical protein n=1 Tax=Curtobacterium sp. MCLR17_045 TaxID=2175629 RepID=UPI000DA70871|nr:hypothetical protein [Curtobacterium sp. MCLR17_045]PZF26899.1 hypothetical protein DEJ05_08315 [Curtobacterium sp. MCLR17_045]
MNDHEVDAPAMSSVTDEELRRLARTVWRGIERGARRLDRACQSPRGPGNDPVDPIQMPSQIVGLSLKAVADHARTMSMVITDPTIGPSTATVARGAMENFGRLHWITVGENADSVQARSLHVLRKDIHDSGKQACFRSRKPGRPTLTQPEYLHATQAVIDELQVPGLDWSVSRALQDISKEKWPQLDPKVPYSTLSAIAHGGVPGLGQLVVDNELRLPRQELINQVGFVLGVADVAVHTLQRCPLPILPPGCVPAQWESIMIELDGVIKQLMAQDTAAAPEETTTRE